MHLFKKVIVGLLAVYGINQLLCSQYGEAALVETLIRDAHTTFRHTPFGHATQVNLFHNSTICSENARRLEAIYQGTPKTVKLIGIDAVEELAPYRDTFNVYNHALLVDAHPLMPSATVLENESIKEYAYTKGWKHQYVWMLTRWVKITDEQTF